MPSRKTEGLATWIFPEKLPEHILSLSNELNSIPLSIALAFGAIEILATSHRHKSYGKVCSSTITITPKAKAMDTDMFRH
ncbi:MAG: hypothetical protein NTX25_16175 [Proteobacteria bacterium]|nr:hypothetical protein [Pseudomonadota bacterium]